MRKEADKEKMVGWDKGGHGTSQHDDPGNYTDSTRLSNLEKNHKGAAVACLSSIAKATSQVSQKKLSSCNFQQNMSMQE